MGESTPMKHDDFGPSKHPAFLKCPAYKSKPGDSIHSVVGVYKHDLVYQLWTGAIKDLLDVGKVTPCGKYPFTENDKNDVLDAWEATKDAVAWLEGKYPNETFNDISEEFLALLNLGIEGGTPDFLYVGKRVVMILDYKFGQAEVSPWSAQLMSYLTGVVDSANPFSDIKHVYSGIIQPKLRDNPWIVKVPVEHLKRHEEMMKGIIESAKSGFAPRSANDSCKYCQHFLKCPVLKASMHRMSAIASQKSNIVLSDMPNDQLGEFAIKLKEIKALAGAAEEEVFLRLRDGEEFDRWELREGRGTRVWEDEEQAEKMLRKICSDKDINPLDLFTMKMVSPAQAEKLVGKSAPIRTVLDPLWKKRPGKSKPEIKK